MPGFRDVIWLWEQFTSLNLDQCPDLLELIKAGGGSKEKDIVVFGNYYNWEDRDRHYLVADVEALGAYDLPAGLAISAGTFPDESFRAYVSTNCDTNRDGYLSDAEIAAVKEIDCSGLGIASLTGITYFSALQKLDCHNNQLKTLYVNSNTALTWLDCSGNSITELNINSCPELLNCFVNGSVSENNHVITYTAGNAQLRLDAAVIVRALAKPVMLTVSDGEVSVLVESVKDADASIFCAGYDKEGRMLWVQQEALLPDQITTVKLNLPVGTAMVKAIAVDGASAPLFEAAQWSAQQPTA